MNVVTRPIYSVSLCTGVGMLDVGVELGFADLGDVRPVLYVEREAYAVDVLVERIRQELIPDAPVWSDLTSIGHGEVSDFLDHGPAIDLVFGGIPCQPWSAAGKQQGKADERDLWPYVRDFVDARRPRWVLIENVRGFAVYDGLGRVASDLQSLGYQVASILLGSGDVGRNHNRERLFTLAHANSLERRSSVNRKDSPTDGRNDSGRCGQGVYAPFLAAYGRNASEWPDVIERFPHLSPALESDLCRMADGMAPFLDFAMDGRPQRLKRVGNGVDPLCAAVAIRYLLRALETDGGANGSGERSSAINLSPE